MVPLSIPSPPIDWSVYYVGSWIHSWLPVWPANFTLPVHFYALIILVGIIVSIVVTNFRLTRRGGEPWIIIDISLWTIALGIIVARAWHVVTHIADYFGPGKNTWNPFLPGAVWNIWDGGDAIFGALLGGALGVLIGSRIAGLRFWSVADALAPTLLLAQALGRLGNYFNHELFGLPTDLPWGLEIESTNKAIPAGLPAGTLFQPTFLYEIVLNLIGFVAIMLITHRRRGGQWVSSPFWQWGKVLGLYLIWYGAVRSWLENIRIDPSQTHLGIRDNVWGAIGAIVVGILIIAIQTRRHSGIEPSVYVPGRQWTPDTVDSDDTYSDDDDDAEVSAPSPATSGARVP
ncbi:prolipoprotein diacylglyceryl transferase [Pseudolysinimonas sp.]|uniref:prolipoprotein diacylglyceryl transferase n=1 Tax=Pseudolysinimonas sp. TaxID=2680009 RepID=UPI003F7E2331